MDGAPGSPIRIGKYEIEAEIGSGGLGRVFRGRNVDNDQLVAVKLLHEKLMRSRRIIGLFHRELLIMSSLHHRHIVSYIDSQFEPPNCFIASEFIDGWSLRGFLHRVPRFPPLVAVALIFDVLQGLDYLHLHDIVHSDLSTANILIDKSGRVCVTDFGLSCIAGLDDHKSVVVGTPGYFSPEHVTESPIVAQSDLYGAGLILFETIAGTKAVVASRNLEEVRYNMKSINFKMIQTGDRRLDRALRSLLKKALHIKPSRRVQTAEEMMSHCYEILSRYRIRFVKYALRQFMVDSNLIPGPLSAPPQQIYIGGKS